MSQPSIETVDRYEPLISPGLIRKTTAIALTLVILTAVLSLAGHWMGERIASGGHSIEGDLREFAVKGETLLFPANAVRFEDQRRGGAMDRLDLYLLFPQMTGYSDADRRHFNDAAASNTLVFLTIRGSTMPLDMSGRYEPVYQRLVQSPGRLQADGLRRHDFLEGTRYVDEVLYIANRADRDPYVVRCLKQSELPPGGRGCMRDMSFGDGLSVEYRFSQDMLTQWQALDEAVLNYVTAARHAGQTDLGS